MKFNQTQIMFSEKEQQFFRTEFLVELEKLTRAYKSYIWLEDEQRLKRATIDDLTRLREKARLSNLPTDYFLDNIYTGFRSDRESYIVFLALIEPKYLNKSLSEHLKEIVQRLYDNHYDKICDVIKNNMNVVKLFSEDDVNAIVCDRLEEFLIQTLYPKLLDEVSVDGLFEWIVEKAPQKDVDEPILSEFENVTNIVDIL